MKEQENKGGRPPHFETPEEMKIAIDNYFTSDHKMRTVLIGKPPNQSSIEVPVITVTGLAIHLGFESRQSLYDYENRDGFSYIVKRAKLFIEQEYEEQLQHGNTTGAIFALKNMGWSDKSEVTLGGDVNIPLMQWVKPK